MEKWCNYDNKMELKSKEKYIPTRKKRKCPEINHNGEWIPVKRTMTKKMMRHEKSNTASGKQYSVMNGAGLSGNRHWGIQRRLLENRKMPNNIIKDIQTGVKNSNLNTGAICNIKERK